MGRSATASESAGLREFLSSGKGQIIAITLALVAVIAAVMLVARQLGPSEAGAIARDRMYIDAKTMKPFEHELKIGDTIPTEAPSGDKSGYPAELCYWTKDGKIKEDPTPVLLKSWLGQSGPTFCPDCGRLVVGHNPRPNPGAKPPPTEAEYKARGVSLQAQER
ncbi:MAG TPA: hypothetical protein VHS31_18930 [Tepidisphaeraceae bacterium]|jgi:hypothetical protein|nr:hypothetical protein [Tepidisphaeraceae bacterium]